VEDVDFATLTCPSPHQAKLKVPEYDPAVFGSPPAAPTFPSNPDEPLPLEFKAPPPGLDPLEKGANTPGSFRVGSDGSANYDIRIDLPPNRAGLVPQLSISYNSNGGTSFSGQGVTLGGFSSIHRCGRTIRKDGGLIGVQLDENDHFCFGDQQLAIAVGAHGEDGTEYRLQPDSLRKIVSHGGTPHTTGPTSFTLWSKEGLIYKFGGSSDNTAEIAGVNTHWFLRKIEDRFGNSIDYTYDRVKPIEGEPVFYPLEIRYGAHGSGLTHDKIIYFDYGQRNDPIVQYRHGARHEIDQKLESIRVTAARGSKLVRRYNLDYTPSTISGKSLLTTITECVDSACKKPIRLQYREGEAGFQAPLTMQNASPNAVYTVMDVDGDGYDDVVYPDDDVWHILYGPWFGPADHVVTTARTDDTFGNNGFQRGFPLDYDHDGRTDLLLADQSPTWRVLLSSGSDFSIVDTGHARSPRVGTGFHYVDGESLSCSQHIRLNDESTIGTYVLDLNGDGLKDILHRFLPTQPTPECTQRQILNEVWRCEGPWYYYLHNGHGFDPPAEIVELRDAAATMAVLPIDADGDGKEEVLIHRCGGDTSYSVPGCDYSNPTPLQILDYRKSGSSASVILRETNITGTLFLTGADFHLIDTNGDGLRDVLERTDDGHLQLWLNDGRDFQLVAPILFSNQNLFSVGEFSNALIIDHDDDGRQDLLIPDDGNLNIFGCPDYAFNTIRVFLSDRTADQLLESTSMPYPAPPASATALQMDFYHAGWMRPLLADVDGDGPVDLVFPFEAKVFRNDASSLTDKLEEIRDGTIDFSGGFEPFATRVVYSPLIPSEYGPYLEDPGVSCSYPCKRYRGPRYVVSATEHDNLTIPGFRMGDQRRVSYVYRNAVMDRHGAGWLGFTSILRTDTHTDDTSAANPLGESIRYTRYFFDPTTYYEPASLTNVGLYPGAGRPHAVLTFGYGDCAEWTIDPNTSEVIPPASSWVRYDAVDHDVLLTYVTWNHTFPSYLVYERSKSTKSYDCAPITVRELRGLADPESALAGFNPFAVETTDNHHPDRFGNLTNITITSEAPGVDLAPNVREVNTTYENIESSWIISRPRVTTITETTATGTEQRRYERFYDTKGYPNIYQISERSDPQHYLQHTYDRDDFGNITRLSIENAAGERVQQMTMTYDPDRVFVHAVSNSHGHTTRYLYDPYRGELNAIVDANGRVTWRLYDDFGTLRQIHHPDGRASVQWVTREAHGSEYLLSLNERNTDGAASKVTFDAQLRPYLMHEVGLRGVSTTVEAHYWAHGGLRRQSRPFPLGGTAVDWMSIDYDRQRRLQTIEATDGVKTLFSYQGSKRTIQDGEGGKTQYIENGLGQIAKTIDALGGSTSYQYGPFGGLRSIDAFGNITIVDIDAYGLRTRIDDPNSGERTFVYDELGRVESAVDARGQETKVCYDAGGRATHRLDTDGLTTLVYDQGVNALGELTAVHGADGSSLELFYDHAGRLYRSLRAIPDAFGTPELFETMVSYTSNGLPESLTYPEVPGAPRFRVRYRYDSFGHLTKLEENGVALWTWDEAGPANEIATFSLGNGTTTHRAYDARSGLLGSIQTTSPLGTMLQNLAYTYDDNGNVQSQTDALQNLTESYEYDLLNRLRALEIDEASIRRDYDYSPDGNLIFKHDIGTLKYDPSDKPHAVRDVAGFQFDYDENGNQTLRPDANGDPVSVGYTAFNKPRSMVGTFGSVAFEYDGLGNRVKRTSPVAVTTYIDGLYRRVAPHTSGTTVHEHSLRSPSGPFLTITYEERQSSTSRTDNYVHGDHLGSPNVITNQAGGLLERISYDPFGERRNPDWVDTRPPPASARWLGFTGHEDEDEILNLVNMGGRMYDPRIGRFLSPDLIVQSPYNSQSLNRFSYVWNNPLTNVDPSGFEQREGEIFLGSLLDGQVGELIETEDGTYIIAEIDKDGDVHVAPYTEVEFNESETGGTDGNKTKPATEVGKASEVPTSVQVQTKTDSEKGDKADEPQPPGREDGSRWGQAKAGDENHWAARTAMTGIELVLGVIFAPAGWVLDATDLHDAIKDGDSVAIAAATIGFVPVVGDFAKGASKAFQRSKTLRRAAGGKCFVAGTMVSTIEGPLPIETLEPGDRVITPSGACGSDAGGSWRIVELVMDNPQAPGDLVHVRSLEDEVSLRAKDIDAVGDVVRLSLEEIDVNGLAIVTQIHPPRSIASGCGLLVRSTVRHYNNDLHRLTFASGEVLEPTGAHPLYSFDRGKWIETRELEKGERLETASGSIEIAQIERVAGAHEVFNFEVEDEHEYLVGEAQVRAHNSCGHYIPRDAAGNPIPLNQQKVDGQDIPLPDPAAQGPHTTLGGRVSETTGELYRQTATFPTLDRAWPGANGQPVPWSRVDWTNHGRSIDHTSPHQHIFKYDFDNKQWTMGPQTPFTP
jgi:RHS repeat-associated protein